MGGISDFVEIINKKIKERVPVQTVWATVVSVDWDKKIMTAKGVHDDLDFFNILLGLEHQYIKPKVNSKALIGIIENTDANAFLIKADEVEEMVIKSGDSTFTIKTDGFIVKKGNETLREILNDFIDEVNKIIVINGTTINVEAVNAIKQRLNTVLIA
jgi:hypothetical protein